MADKKEKKESAVAAKTSVANNNNKTSGSSKDKLKEKIKAGQVSAQSSGLKNGDVFVKDAGTLTEYILVEDLVTPAQLVDALRMTKKANMHDIDGQSEKGYGRAQKALSAEAYKQVMSSRKKLADDQKRASLKAVIAAYKVAAVKLNMDASKLAWGHIVRCEVVMEILAPVVKDNMELAWSKSFGWVHNPIMPISSSLMAYLNFVKLRFKCFRKVFTYYSNKEMVKTCEAGSREGGFIIISKHQTLTDAGAKHYLKTKEEFESEATTLADASEMNPETHARAMMRAAAIIAPHMASQCAEFKLAKEGEERNKLRAEIVKAMFSPCKWAGAKIPATVDIMDHESDEMQIYHKAMGECRATKNSIARLSGVKGGANTRSKGFKVAVSVDEITGSLY